MTKSKMVIAACIASLALMATASIDAFPLSRYNDLTFSRAVALPGVTLAAGKYRFDVVNVGSGADIVRVSNPETSQVYFMRHTLRANRPPNMPTQLLVTFGEAREGQAPPIRIWFPRGGGDGRQFV